MAFTQNPETFAIDSLLDYLLRVSIALLYNIYIYSYKVFYNWSLDFGFPGIRVALLWDLEVRVSDSYSKSVHWFLSSNASSSAKAVVS
jgi:hypothetical protein